MKRLGIVSVAAAATAVGLGGLADAAPEPASSVPHARPSGSVGLRSSQAEIAESFRKHRPNPDELKAALAAAQAGAKDCREARVLEMRQHYAAATLANREVFAELRVHAKRMAFLNRAKVVATTELDEPKRSKVIARVEKLTLAEQARHLHHMEVLRASSPGEAAGAARFAASAPGPSGAPIPSGAPVPDASGRMKPPKPHGPPLSAPGVARGPAPKGSAP